MEGPSGVLALVLAETAAGTAGVLWLSGLWGTVKRGFFILASSVALTFALLGTLSAAVASSASPSDEVRTAVLLAAAASALLGLSLAALVVGLTAPGRWLGTAAVPVAVAALVALAALVAPAFWSALLQLLAGALFMGAVTAGLLLGHWYLVDRRLTRGPIDRYATLLLVAVVLELAAVGALGFGDPAAGAGFSLYLGIAGLSTWLALGMVACTALIAVLIRATLKGTTGRAVQAATGFFYLAVITAFTGELAAKVGFLG